jgi:GGDEF domain-containing protein
MLGAEGVADRGFLWFLGLLPVLLWGYAFRWRGAAAALAVTLAVLVLVETTGAARGSPPTPSLGGIVLALLLIAGAIAFFVETMWRDRGDLEDVALTDRLTSLPQPPPRPGLSRDHVRRRGTGSAGLRRDLRPRRFPRLQRPDGEAGGDEALQAFAALLASSTRRMNLSARIGGEEFMSILSGADEEGARAFADRVRETFRQSRPASRELTVSAGVASFHPSMRTPDELVGAADLALFRAKEEGGDRVRVFGKDVRTGDVAPTVGHAPRGDAGDGSSADPGHRLRATGGRDRDVSSSRATSSPRPTPASAWAAGSSSSRPRRRDPRGSDPTWSGKGSGCRWPMTPRRPC